MINAYFHFYLWVVLGAVFALGFAFGLFVMDRIRAVENTLKQPTTQIITPFEAEPISLKAPHPSTITDKIRAIAKDEGYADADYLIDLTFCESSLNQFALGDNEQSHGLWQIHEPAHPDMSIEEMYNVEMSTRWTINQLKQGRHWMWTCDELI